MQRSILQWALRFMTRAQDSTASVAPEATPLYVHILVMALILLPCIAVSQFIAHWRFGVLDDHLFGYYGWRICGGATLYVDIWDNKPPGIFWINALGLLIGGGHYGGVMVLCLLASVLSCVLFFVVSASVYHRGTAALATVLAGFYLTHGVLFAGGNRFETYMIPCELGAMALYLRGFGKQWGRKGGKGEKPHAWWCWYAAGLCCGGALLLKQTGLAAFGAMGLHLLLLAGLREIDWRYAVRRAGLLVGGLVTVVGAAALWLAGEGSLGEAWFAVFQFNQWYFDHVERGWLEWRWWSRRLDGDVLAVLRLPVLMAIAAIVHAGLWRLLPRFRPAEVEGRWSPPLAGCPRLVTLFGIWFGAAALLAAAGPRNSSHYLLPVMPPLLLLGGYLINVLKTEVRLLRRLVERAWVVVAFLLMGYFAAEAIYLQVQGASQVWWDRDPRSEGGRWVVDRTTWERLGEEIALITAPDDRIQTWEYMPGIYLQARRPNACRFAFAGFMEMVGPRGAELEREFLQTLREHPPEIIVMTAHKYGELRAIGAAGPPESSAAALWLDAEYRRLPEITYANCYVFARSEPAIGLED